jgi:hypothetical protein
MLDAMSHRTDFDSTVTHAQAHGTAEITTHRFADQGHSIGIERLAGGQQVAFPHLHGSRGSQRGKHAGTPRQPSSDVPAPGSVGNHQLKQARYGRLREFCHIPIHASERRRGEKHMSHSAHPSFGIV